MNPVKATITVDLPELTPKQRELAVNSIRAHTNEACAEIETMLRVIVGSSDIAVSMKVDA
jgi:hypothetical protein